MKIHKRNKVLKGSALFAAMTEKNLTKRMKDKMDSYNILR